ncbi:hypothetical protein P4T04_15580 [Bacillus badius]|uniref:hypothetical protein n=1 Tax=Bacillus badius TaxID=1455 RepID=UPI002E1B7113|nr:hypothetical protein [Bacillus badius]
MLNKKFYSWSELEDELGVQFTKKNNRAKLIRRNIEPFYIFKVLKGGRAQIGIDIIGYREIEKSVFMKLCEKVCGSEVTFPEEKTAEKILKVLASEDRTILNNEDIGYEVPGYLERHTIGTYIDLFRKYGILPPILPKVERPCFSKETAEIFSTTFDPNKYTYYAVSIKEDFREEITEVEYFEMIKFMKSRYSECLSEYLHVLDSDDYDQEEKEEIIKSYSQEAKKNAAHDCMKEYGGIPKKSVSKFLTPKALEVFREYLSIKDKAA